MPGQRPADEVEAAIVEVAVKNPTDGYRLVTAWVRRRLGRAVNGKRVLGVMRERRLIRRRRRLDRRVDMTSVWVAEHGSVYLMATIDCCTRENVERAVAERGITPGSLTLGTDNGGVHRPRVEGRPRRPGDRA